MAKTTILFDLDGTLTDSMAIWDRAPRELVRRHGGRPPQDLAEALREMGRREACGYLRRRFGLAPTVEQLMEEINEQGTTVVVVTHNLEIVKAMNKRVITMQKGVVIDDTASDHYGKDTSVEQDDDLFDDFLDDGGDDDYAD